MRAAKRARYNAEGETVVQYGAKEGDVVYSQDGSEIQIDHGNVRASRRGCERDGLTILQDIEYDNLDCSSALGKGCECKPSLLNCPHAATATLKFLAVGTNIRNACKACGSDPDELLHGIWDWKTAFLHMKKNSKLNPSLQLRRTIFRKKSHVLVRAKIDMGENCTVLGQQISGREGIYEIPGLKTFKIWAELVPRESLRGEVIAAGVISGVTEKLYSEVSKLSASQLKSLMQKLVRWGKSVECCDNDTDAVLVCCFVALSLSKGQFLPQVAKGGPSMGKHSKGPRLALQRMVITLIEDGICLEDFGPDILYYAALAGVSQETGRVPCENILSRAANMLVRGRHSDTVLNWRESKRQAGATLPFMTHIKEVFKYIGSMENDILMIDAIKDRDRFLRREPSLLMRVPLERIFT